jgi:hypothetical protein
MADYNKDWPVHDMLKTYLKNSSQPARNAKGRETADQINKVNFLPREILRSYKIEVGRGRSTG